MCDEERQAFRQLTDAVGAILQAHLTMTTMSIRQIETEHRAFLETMDRLGQTISREPGVRSPGQESRAFLDAGLRMTD